MLLLDRFYVVTVVFNLLTSSGKYAKETRLSDTFSAMSAWAHCMQLIDLSSTCFTAVLTDPTSTINYYFTQGGEDVRG